MKNLCFELAFIGSLFCFQLGANAQASVDPGDGTKWICCQVTYENFCTDMSGTVWSSDVQRFGVETCS
jgi:hypothetical protein